MGALFSGSAGRKLQKQGSESLMGKREDSARGPEHAFSFWVAVAFSCNYIMGCGFLGLPSAFVKSGVLLGPLLILLGGLIMNATKDLVLEAMARAEAMAKASQICSKALRHASAGDNSQLAGGRTLIVPEQADYLVDGARKFEVTDLCLMLVGKTARNLYAVILSMYMYGGLCAYASVWASSFSANVPVPFLNGGATCNIEQAGSAACSGLYLLWLAVFAVVAVPLACLDLEEQIGVQVVMFGARVLVVALLTGSVAVGMASCDGVVFAEVPPGKPQPTPLFDAGGLAVIIPVSIFAFIFHHSIPGLSAPVGDKAGLPRMFATAFGIITLFYASVGLLVAVFFGDAVNSQCSLNWRQYVGCMPRPANYTLAYGGVEQGPRGLVSALAAAFSGAGAGEGLLRSRGLTAPACSSPDTWAPDGSCVDWESRPPYAHALAFVVLIFPALDVLSAFPLNAITLGNNLMSAVLGEASLKAPPPAAEEQDEGEGEGEGGEEADSGGDGGVCRKRRGRTSRGRGSPRVARAGVAPSGAVGGAPVPWYLRTARMHGLTKIAFRLVAAVPPLVVTAFVSDLGVILQFTGLVGVAIAFTIPALLALYGRAKQRSMFGLMSRHLLAQGQSAGEAADASQSPLAALPSVAAPVAHAALADAAAAARDDSDEAGRGLGAGSASPVASSDDDRVPLVSGGSGTALGGPSASGSGGDAVLDALAAAAKGASVVRFREALTSVPDVDGALRQTPYTSWAARGRGAEVVLAASVVIGLYVTVQTALDVARG